MDGECGKDGGEQMFTIQQVDDYVKQKGMRCPYCGSVGHIEAGKAIPDAENSQINQSMKCRSCKQDWLDVYNLASICDEDGTPVRYPAKGDSNSVPNPD